MEAQFWHQKWAQGEIRFHQSEVNPFLKTHLANLNLAAGARVFLPLCGKTLDIAWLLAQGYRVVGAELSELAIQALFEQLGLAPQIVQNQGLIHYSAQDLDIFVGDIFELSAGLLGPVDAVYDRAALVALPPEIRPKYAAHTTSITGTAPQLLIAYEYDQRLRAGPPFSVEIAEIAQIFGSTYAITSLVRHTGEIRPGDAATEAVWLLQAKQV